jgi:hypothetical protein
MSDFNCFFFYAELQILDQKNLQTEGEIEGHNREEKALTCSVASLSNKLLSLNSKLCERKDCKENLDRENLHMHNYYTNMLKVCLLFIVIQNPVFVTFTAAKWKPRWSTFFYITYINSVRTSQEAQYISVV